jgi:hypothetical protein
MRNMQDRVMTRSRIRCRRETEYGVEEKQDKVLKRSRIDAQEKLNQVLVTSWNGGEEKG